MLSWVNYIQGLNERVGIFQSLFKYLPSSFIVLPAFFMTEIRSLREGITDYIYFCCCLQIFKEHFFAS